MCGWCPTAGRLRPSIALGRAVSLIDDAKYHRGRRGAREGDARRTRRSASYRQYYAGLLAFRAGRLDEAQAIFGCAGRSVSARISRRCGPQPRRRNRGAAAALRRCGEVLRAADRKESLAADQGWIRLARARQGAGDPRGAAEAYAHVYYEFPLSDLATVAAGEIGTLNAWEPLEKGSTRYKMELGRAQRLFGAARYAQARDAFDMLRPLAEGDEQELAELRVAECDYYLKRYGSARDALDALDRPRPPSRRSPVLPSRLDARAGRACRVRPPRDCAGRGVSERFVGRRHAEQPGHALHPRGRRRPGGRDVPRAGLAVSRQPLRAARAAGRSAGTRTARGVGRKRPSSSSRPRRATRAPTTGRRGSTGPRARAISLAMPRVRTGSTASSSPTT